MEGMCFAAGGIWVEEKKNFPCFGMSTHVETGLLIVLVSSRVSERMTMTSDLQQNFTVNQNTPKVSFEKESGQWS